MISGLITTSPNNTIAATTAAAFNPTNSANDDNEMKIVESITTKPQLNTHATENLKQIDSFTIFIETAKIQH